MAGTHRARGWSFSASVQRGWQRLTTTITDPYTDSHPASPTLATAGSRRRPQSLSIGAVSSSSGLQIPPQPTSSSSSFVNRLLPELWITIFELASSSHSSSLVMVDPLDITAEHPWDTRTYPLHLLLSTYLATQDTLRSLCLISHTLYEAALSLLMRHVWLHRRAHARRLARTLSSRPTLGTLIRRIDVEIAGDSIQVSALDVRDILRHCGGGLVCFTDKRGTYTNVGRWDAQYEAMLPALVTSGGGGTLRSVKVVQYAPAAYGRRHWSALVEGFASGAAAMLYELGIDLSLSLSTGGGAGVGVGVGSHLAFPTLRVLEVTLGAEYDSDALSTIASWDLPRLHTLRLLGTFTDPDGFTRLLTSHGAKLLHLELETLPSTFTSLVPNLRMFTLTLSHPLSLSLWPMHPTIERITIRNLSHLASSTHHGTLLSHLSSSFSRTRFPRLRVIRVSGAGEGESESTIMRLFWMRLGDEMARDGVVLEDLFGRTMDGGSLRARVQRTW